jgi:tRNA pseudouridine55 synthase
MVDRVRRALAVRRVGHTGTLDPMATGVLLICVGKATRLASFLSAGEKVYLARVRFGFATSTDDAAGEPLGPAKCANPELEAVQAACQSLTGDLLQVPPAFSAKRVRGRRLYELARSGVATERSPARVTVHSLDLRRLATDRAELEVRCSAGTYVRALARDLGEALGVGGHLESLRRTWTGGFGLEGAVSGEALTPEVTREGLLPMSEALKNLPGLRIDASSVALVRAGRDLNRGRILSELPREPPPRVRILDPSGALVALAVPRGFGFEGHGLEVEPVFHPDVVLID